MMMAWIPFFTLLAMAPVEENPLKMTLHEMSMKAQDLPNELDADRLEELDAMAEWIAEQPTGTATEMTFICTHNSRRSHMGQIWAQAAAWHFGLNDVRTFSGGTEATAFNPRAVRALKELGVTIEVEKDGENPLYTIQLQDERAPFEAFSKKYTDEANPQKDFAAVMVCSSADQGCPLVYGASARFSIPYIDPKVSDGTEAEAATYRARAMQIGAEMFYVMARAAELRAQ
jgi:arsenate reductase (thioredoxin)